MEYADVTQTDTETEPDCTKLLKRWTCKPLKMNLMRCLAAGFLTVVTLTSGSLLLVAFGRYRMGTVSNQ